MTRRLLVLAAVVVVAVLPGAGLDHLATPVDRPVEGGCAVDLDAYLSVPNGVDGGA